MDDGPRIRIRDMTLADCDAVARVRVRGWQWAYAGMMPQAYLDAMSAEDDAARRRARFTPGDSNVVAERDGRVIGWGCYGPYRDEGRPTGDAELYALYVLPEHHATGAGRALTAELITRAAADGYPRMLLWVVTANARARRFYATAGFGPDGAVGACGAGGVDIPECRYARRLSAADAAAPSRG